MSSALVAIVDDDPRIQELLGAELTDLNQPHCSYSSADALLGDINNSHPALIFLDVLMPGMGGMPGMPGMGGMPGGGGRPGRGGPPKRQRPAKKKKGFGDL